MNEKFCRIQEKSDFVRVRGEFELTEFALTGFCCTTLHPSKRGRKTQSLFISHLYSLKFKYAVCGGATRAALIYKKIRM